MSAALELCVMHRCVCDGSVDSVGDCTCIDHQHKFVEDLQADIGELQLAVQSLNDVTEAHREMLQGLGSNVAEIQGGMLEASGHACDDRPRCAKCGIRIPRHTGHTLVKGWAGRLCDPCVSTAETANEIRGDWD